MSPYETENSSFGECQRTPKRFGEWKKSPGKSRFGVERTIAPPGRTTRAISRA